MRITLSIILIFAIAAVLAAGCASKPSSQTPGHEMLAMAPMKDMPVQVQQAPDRVGQAYQFAAANPETMQALPCYCGCGPIGHKSNYDCYIVGAETAGALTFDTHALGCDICVDITQDTMRLLRDGKSVSDIRTYVDGVYSRFGSSNMP